MEDQFGTITVREARLTKREVEAMIHETLYNRGPSNYEFDYEHPVFIWQRDGGVTIRWPSRALREEPGRRPSELRLTPLSQFVEEESRRQQERAATAAAKAKPAPPPPPPPEVEPKP